MSDSSNPAESYEHEIYLHRWSEHDGAEFALGWVQQQGLKQPGLNGSHPNLPGYIPGYSGLLLLELHRSSVDGSSEQFGKHRPVGICPLHGHLCTPHLCHSWQFSHVLRLLGAVLPRRDSVLDIYEGDLGPHPWTADDSIQFSHRH